MRRIALLSILPIAAAGYVFLQTRAAAGPELAAYMPSGAVLYLESPDFGRLLRDWDASQVKADWLGSANYAVFSRSNLFSKLGEVYGQYGDAAGFRPSVKSLIEIAGAGSALALYDIRDVEFLYVSRIAESDLVRSPLWAVRPSFQERQAGGVTFYLRTDAASKRTVAFAFAKGYLILATRDDLVAQSLELLAGGGIANIAADRWYRDAVAQAPARGELRMVMNLELLVKSVSLRSYWVQRNVSTIRPYWTGVADVKRSAEGITETRAFLRAPGSAAVTNSAVLPALLALVPPEAGVYRVSGIADPAAAARLIIDKIIGAPAEASRDWRDAPEAVSPDYRAGSEGDLETRIDEQPLPADTGLSDSLAAARGVIDQGGARALLLVESSATPGTFVKMPAVIVLASSTDWNRDSVRGALGDAAGKLWTTSHLGAGWTAATVGRHSVDRLDGLGTLLVATSGPLLFVANDASLLAAVLDHGGSPANSTPFTYAAGVRYRQERANYERVMAAVDFTSAASGLGFYRLGGAAAPNFFSGNLASLSRVLSKVVEIGVTEEERGVATMQTVRYRIER
jgi:hypothetical protein